MGPHCPTGAGAAGTRILVTDGVRAQTEVWGPRDVIGSRLAAFPGTSDAWDGVQQLPGPLLGAIGPPQCRSELGLYPHSRSRPRWGSR